VQPTRHSQLRDTKADAPPPRRSVQTKCLVYDRAMWRAWFFAALAACISAPRLAAVITEPPGANCEHGGVAIITGADDDGDATLDPDEIDATDYVCTGDDGTAGHQVLADTQPEAAGANCPLGGTRIRTGIDADDDGILADAEVVHVVFVCNPSSGTATVGRTRYEPPGPNCALGGVAIESGLDIDADGTLDDLELASTNYVCNATVPSFEVINGNFVLATSFDAAMLAPTRRITGSLTIQPITGLDPVVVPALEQLDRELVVASSNFTRLELPAVQSVRGIVTRAVPLFDTLVMPALAAVETLDMSAPRLPLCQVTDILAHTSYTGAIPALEPCVAVDRCRLVLPVDGIVAAGTQVETSGRLRVLGRTDLTPGIDALVVVRAAAGVGAPGTDPATHPSWRFTTTPPRADWNDAPAPGFDEFATTLAPAPGMYDVATRFSGDGGRTFMYCDRNGSEDGYQPAHAGHLEVQ
jgi:hypothetical protein